MLPLRRCLLAVMLCLLPPAGALAAPSKAAVTAEARFRDGREAMKRGDYEGALALLDESQRLVPAPGTLLNLAICEDKLGKLSLARRHFTEALSALPRTDERVAFVSDSLASLEQRLPRLRIQLRHGGAPGTRVALDGAVVDPSRLDTDIALDPGAHVLVVSVPSRPDQRYQVVLAEGARSVVAVEPAAQASAPQPVPARPRASDAPTVEASPLGSRRIAALLVGGVGVFGVGVGSVTGVMALSTRADLERECPERAACTPEGLEKASSGRTLSAVSTAALAAGVVGLGVGAIVWLTAPHGAPSAVVARIEAVPGGGAVALGGSF